MNINPILNQLKDKTGFPTNENYYPENEESWITYNYADVYKDTFSDNVASQSVASIQIHLFMPSAKNFHPVLDLINSFLEDKNFEEIQWQTLYENDSKMNHVIFTCSYRERKEQ